MRRLVVALVVAVMLVSLTGCGGGGGDETGQVTTQTQTGTTTQETAATGDEDPVPDASPLEGQVFEPFPTNEEVLTDEIAERLDAHQPMIVFFYDSAQQTSDDQRAEIDAVLEDYRGLIELVSYDVGEYVETGEDGSIVVLPEMAEDEDAQKVARLFSDNYLGVTFTPYLVFVDSDGYIVYRYRGPVDRKLIEREVLRATE